MTLRGQKRRSGALRSARRCWWSAVRDPGRPRLVLGHRLVHPLLCRGAARHDAGADGARGAREHAGPAPPPRRRSRPCDHAPPPAQPAASGARQARRQRTGAAAAAAARNAGRTAASNAIADRWVPMDASSRRRAPAGRSAAGRRRPHQRAAPAALAAPADTDPPIEEVAESSVPAIAGPAPLPRPQADADRRGPATQRRSAAAASAPGWPRAAERVDRGADHRRPLPAAADKPRSHAILTPSRRPRRCAAAR